MKTELLKRPLLISDISEIFDRQNFPDRKFDYANTNNPIRFNYMDYTRVFNEFIYNKDLFYNNPIPRPLPRDLNGVHSSGFLGINEKMKNKYCSNIYKIEFERLYPSIISKLLKEDKIKFNYQEFEIVYSFIVDNYNLIKDYCFTENGKKLLNIFVNYTFGIISGDRYSLRGYNFGLVTEYTKFAFTNLMEQHTNNIIHMDTDTIYLDYPSEEILKLLDHLYLKYNISSGFDAIFTGNKNYLLFNKNSVIEKRGIREHRSEYKHLKQK